MIEKILNILGQSGHFYRIVSEGYCVPEKGRKLIVEVESLLPQQYQYSLQNIGFDIKNVEKSTMYFVEK